MTNLGPTQQRMYELHARKQSPAQMQQELGVTRARVYALHRLLGLIPHTTTGPARPAPRRSRAEIDSAVAARRAALATYWRDHPAASADEAAAALGLPVASVRYDRRMLDLHIRRDDAGAVQRLAAAGLPVAEIARRTGRPSADIRTELAGGGATGAQTTPTPTTQRRAR